MERELTKEGWLEIFGSLTWDNGGGFQLVFEQDPYPEEVRGTVWLQTKNAEDDSAGRSCMLPNVRLWHDADELKHWLSSQER